MKKIALMGLMAAVLVFALLSCDEGISTNPDGGSGSDAQGVGDDTGDKDGSVTIYDGSGGQDATTGGDEYHSDGGDTGDGGEVCDGDVYWLCVTGSGGNCCGDAGLRPRCYDRVPVCPQGMIPEYECTSYCDVGQPWPDAGFDGGGDGGTSDGGQVVCTADCPTSEMVDVPAGVFMMGCNNAVDTECAPEENPYHEVNVPDFEIDKYEVIVSDYKTCVDAGGCTAADTRKDCNYGASGKDDHPINCVKWGQAKSFCLWAGKRLPTEAEWEKAARGTDGRKYPWGNDSLDCDHAVISVPPCSNPGTAPVGSKPAGASPYGVLDMIGNVWEMVEDDWHDSYSGAPVDGSAWVENPRIVPRVLRGGGLQADSDNLDTLRASHRWYYEINFNGHDVGFRCALSVP